MATLRAGCFGAIGDGRRSIHDISNLYRAPKKQDNHHQQYAQYMNTIELSYTIYIIVVVIISIATYLKLHTKSNNEVLVKAYVHQISEHLNHQATQRILAHNNHEREALLEALHLIMAHSYAIDLSVVYRTIYDNSLDRYIRRRIFGPNRNFRKALMLHRLSYLPHNYDSEELKKFLHSKDSDLRRGALLATLACNPSMAIATITKIREPLSATDITQIISLFRRNMLPIACEPLLKSPNRNLCLLGMAIARNFGVTMAQEELYSILSHSHDKIILQEALYTLCSLGTSPQSRALRLQILSTEADLRKSLCRHLSTEGYSADAIHQMIPTNESNLAEQIILSHKRLLHEPIGAI